MRSEGEGAGSRVNALPDATSQLAAIPEGCSDAKGREGAGDRGGDWVSRSEFVADVVDADIES
jgi:hypothetical protein